MIPRLLSTVRFSSSQIPNSLPKGKKTEQASWLENPGRAFAGYFILSATGISFYFLSKIFIDQSRLDRAIESRYNDDAFNKMLNREAEMIEYLKKTKQSGGTTS